MDSTGLCERHLLSSETELHFAACVTNRYSSPASGYSDASKKGEFYLLSQTTVADLAHGGAALTGDSYRC